MSIAFPSIDKPVAIIAGPTASGKSGAAVELAFALRARGRRGVVVNADSMQVYRDLRILSARPSDEEMRGVTHRLYGVRDGACPCSAADWAAMARREIDMFHAEGAVPILVGGTGLYLRALIEGIAPVPPIDDQVRRTVRALDPAEARIALEREDAAAAAKLAPADRSRTQRALEVVRSTGRPLSDWQGERIGGIGERVTLFPTLLQPNRETLYRCCEERFARMLDEGAIAEVTRLLERELDPSLPVMKAIGVPEITALIEGRANRTETIEAGSRATRNYVKRQSTWFARQTPNWWPRTSGPNSIAPNIIERMFHRTEVDGAICVPMRAAKARESS